MDIIESTIEKTIVSFCHEFLENPYYLYTEHGIHAYFYSLLYNALPENNRFSQLDNYKICLLQKEYPTAYDLEKSRRQHWDIAYLDKEMKGIKDPQYDYLRIHTAIEFGLNEAQEHLEEDVRRLDHKDSNILNNKYILHLYRLSQNYSNRDWSERSKRIIKPNDVKEILVNKSSKIPVYYVCRNFSDNHNIIDGIFKITSTSIVSLNKSVII